jgi:hypothetical protein
VGILRLFEPLFFVRRLILRLWQLCRQLETSGLPRLIVGFVPPLLVHS